MPRTESRAQFLHDVFVTAIEGGVNYWASVASYHWTLGGPEPLDNCDLEGFRAEIIDNEDEGKRYDVARKVIARGINLIASGKCTYGGRVMAPDMVKAYRAINATNEGGDVDANRADNIVQAGLFGDIRYG